MSSILQEVSQTCEIALNGGVFVYPTDTIWGIGCDATNEEAIEKVKLIKGRAADKSFIVLVPNLKTALKYLATPPLDIETLYQSFEKPTTVIFDNAINLPENLINADGSIAIRIPKDDFCIQLLKKLNRPIVSTSANFSGLPSPMNFQEIHSELLQKVDYVVNWRRNELAPSQPSTIIKVNPNGVIQVIRA